VVNVHTWLLAQELLKDGVVEHILSRRIFTSTLGLFTKDIFLCRGEEGGVEIGTLHTYYLLLSSSEIHTKSNFGVI
jgi:hypothetical protein